MAGSSRPLGTLLEEIAKGKTFSQDDLFVPVMGPTGAGKSTFIAICTGEKMKISHGMESCTQEVGVATTTYEGRKVHLIDTPGFDDTYIPEIEILREIATWLLSAFKADIKLSGVIYLHPISHSRVGGSALRNMRTFKKMFGTENMSCVVLATTFWSNVSDQEGDVRERDLKNLPQLWGDMRSRGSAVVRHSNDRNSTRNILNLLLEQKIKFTMAIQRQMGDDGVLLDETDAGQELNKELLAQKREWEKRLKLAEEDTARAVAARDEELTKEKLEDQKHYITEIKKREESMMAMNVKMEDLLSQQQKRFKEELEVVLASRDRADSNSMALTKRYEELYEIAEQRRQEYDDLQRSQSQQGSMSSTTLSFPTADGGNISMVGSANQNLMAAVVASQLATGMLFACVVM